MSIYSRLTQIEEEEDKKKRELTPSQVASREQKTGSLYERLTTKTAEVEEVTPSKKTFAEKAKPVIEKAKQVATGVGKFLFGEKEVKKSEVGRPLSVQLSDEQYVPMVGQVQQYREEATQQLVEAEKARKDYYAGGIKQADPYLDKRVDALKWAIEDYDEFLGNEPANRGFIKSIVKSVKKNGLVPSWYEDVIATKQGEAYNKYKKGEKLTTEEQGYLNSFRASMYKTLVSNGLGDLTGEVAAGIPKYALLIAATTQGVKPTVSSFSNAVMPKVPQGVLQNIVPKILNNSISLATASNLNFPGISAQTANYMLPTVDIEKEIGTDILDQLKPGDAPMEAQKKAYLSNLIEYVSEGAGAYLDDALPFVKKLIVGKWLKNKGVDLANPNLVKKFLGSGQFNSLAGEVFEEEIAEPLQAKIEGRKYADPLFTPEGRERLLVEVLGIGAFSGMAKVSDAILNKALTRRKSNNDVIDIPVQVEEKKETPLPPVIEEEIGKKEEEPKVAPKVEGVESALHLPGKKVYAKVSPEQLAVLKNEVANIPFTSEDAVHLTPLSRLIANEVKEISLDEIKKLSPNANKALLTIEEGPPVAPKKAEEPKVAPVVGKEPQPKGVGGARTYKIIKKEGIVEVNGEPVKIAEGLDTFIHKGTGGWVVSESSSGRYMADGLTQNEAITKAKKAVKDIGIEKVKKIIAEKPLSQGRGVPDNFSQPPTGGVGGVTQPKGVGGEGVKVGQDIKELDAQIRKITEPTKEIPEWTVEIGLQESLGEQGGDVVTWEYDSRPTLKEIKKDIIEEYKRVKAEINEEVVPGITSKTGRDDMIEGAIDKVLETEEPAIVKDYLERATEHRAEAKKLEKFGEFEKVNRATHLARADVLEETAETLKESAKKEIGLKLSPNFIEEAKQLKREVELKRKTVPQKPAGKPKVSVERVYNLISKPVKSLPILNNVQAKNGMLNFTDLETAVSIPTGLEDGIYEMVGKDLIKTKIPSEDFPVVKPEDTPKAVADVLTDTLTPLLKKAFISTANDERRPVLSGAKVDIKGEKMTITTTDGFRLFHQEGGVKGIEDTSFILGGLKNVANLMDLLSEQRIHILEGKGFVTFDNDNGQITVRKVEGTFPNYKQIFPAYTKRIKISKKDWSAAVKEIMPYVKESANLLKIQVKENEMILIGQRPESAGGAKKEVTIKISKTEDIKTPKGGLMKGSIIMPVRLQDEAPKGMFALNNRFAIDVANQFDGDDLYLDLASALDPIHFSDEPEPVVSVSKKETISAPTGASAASVDKFADLENLTNSLNKFNVVEFPELLRMTKELMGGVPSVKRPRFRPSLGGYPLGLFIPVGKGQIMLNPDVFKDPAQAAKTFAHEIGHLTDYIPEGTLKRGNLVGRIATMLKNMGSIEGIKNKEVTAELKKLTQLWKPFDEENVSESFRKYRYSARELYADAISVLFNDPELLKENAPIFWKGFFDYIDNKPEVKENFFKIWDLLNTGEEAVLTEREKDIRGMFQKGEDLYKAKLIERSQREKNYLFRLKYEIIDKNQAVIDLVEKSKKEGKYIPDDKNPVYWLEGNNYVGGKVKAFLEKNIQPIYVDLKQGGVTWEDFGEVLFLERAINERGKLANPLGYAPETAKKQLGYLETQLGSDKWQIIQKNISKYREAVKSILDDALESGLYKPELVEEMKANVSYATYQVLDYMDTYIPASIKHQVGTLKEIANPASSTMIKTISIIRAIERNRAKRSIVDFLKKNFPEEIKDARTMWTGKTHIPLDSKESDEALFTLMEEGKYKGYYVDPYVAATMETMGTGHINAVISTLRFFNSKLFRPLFITFNVGFQTFNLMRDFMRFYKNTPNLSLVRAVQRYGESLPSAYKRAWDIPDKTIQEMEESKILSVTYNDVIAGMTENDKQIDLILQRVGLSPLGAKKTNIFFKIPLGILDTISKFGNFIETIPKVAGYKELQGKLPNQELASFIRTSVGSPDILRRGAGYSWYNELFLFSNSIKEGIRADYNVAFKNPRTRSGFWWKTAMVTFLPKMIMFAGLMGLFGEAIKKMLEDASEYDKTNYTVVPMGRDKNGLTAYLRIPQDETGRLLGGIMWKALRIANNNKPIYQDLTDLLSYTGGQLPSLTPSIETLSTTMQFLAGQNPYDFFRGYNVIPDQEFQAGGMYALKPFLTWQFNQMGGGIFQRFYTTQQAPTTKTWVQKAIDAPVVSNILGRWIKVSNQGQKEKNRTIIEKTSRDEAVKRLENKELINDAVKEYNSGEQSMTRRLAIERQLVLDVVGKGPYKDTKKTAQTNTIKKFHIALIKGEADENINSIISATTNEQKFELLKQINSEMDKDKFNELTKTLIDENIISKELLQRVRKELQSYVPESIFGKQNA